MSELIILVACVAYMIGFSCGIVVVGVAAVFHKSGRR